MKRFILLTPAILLISLSVDAFELRGIQKNNQGVSEFKKEQLTNSHNEFVKGLADLPFQPEVHYNLGRVFYENKEYEKSYQESMTAARLSPENSKIRFESLFQAAAALAQMKKVDDAIATYQKALEIEPNSKETKTNIELLVASGGQGEGENKDQQKGDSKDQSQKDQSEQPQDGPRTNQPPPNQPKPFKGEDLSKRDVENILDELKRQEEQIRAKFQREGAKDAPKDKDW